MSSGLRQAASAVRKVSRRHALNASPPAERFKVVKLKPHLVVEAYASDRQLSDADDDVEVARGVRRLLAIGDDVRVVTDREGDHLILGSTSESTRLSPQNVRPMSRNM